MYRTPIRKMGSQFTHKNPYVWELLNKQEPECNVWEYGNCKASYILYDGTPLDNRYFYCPNCGYPKTHFEFAIWEDEE